jgi:nucleoside-diphosphate-sugar epimerase
MLAGDIAVAPGSGGDTIAVSRRVNEINPDLQGIVIIDGGVDFLAFGGSDVERLLGVPGFDPGRLVMISSGQVYLVTASPRPPFREEAADQPLMAEPRPGSRDHGQWAYGVGKRAAEAALARARVARGLPSLALRLPIVQGEADRDGSRRLWAWLERMLDGGPVLLPEEGRQIVRFVYAGDVAEALVALAMLGEGPEFGALNLAQPDETSLRDCLVLVAELAGAAPRFVSVDRETLERAGLADTCAPYWGHWVSRPDPSRAADLLVARPRPLAEYLPAVVRAHLELPRPLSHQGYVHRSEEVVLAHRLEG